MKTQNNILEAIGNTPIVKITKLNVNKNVEIYAKLEGHNPGGSIKDRTALYLIKDAEERKLLNHNKIILEPTSGNTGIGLALVCAYKGLKCTIVLPESVSIERRQMLKAFGAELILSPGEKGTDGAIDLANEILKNNPDKYIMLDQFNNPANIKAHYETTGKEIIEQLADKKIDYFIAGIGTSGTIMGAGQKLKERFPDIKIIAVEPTLDHKVQGLKNLKEAHIPGIFDRNKIDDVLTITDEEAFNYTSLLAKKEGIFVGISSGAALAGCLKIAAKINKGIIVTIFPDNGYKYLSTSGLFT